MQQDPTPSFGAKFKRFIAIEFLIIVSIFILCVVLDYLRGDDMMNRNSIYSLGIMLYFVIVFIRLLIRSIKIVFFPNSSK